MSTPLDPMPMTACQVADLVRRVKKTQRRPPKRRATLDMVNLMARVVFRYADLAGVSLHAATMAVRECGVPVGYTSVYRAWHRINGGRR